MTISGYSNAIVDVMLGWLKGLANWVLRLFNLAGSVSGSPLLWLSQNWLKLLIFFLVLGIVLDRLVWLIRWRPYWVWFRKERVIVNDDRFFSKADKADDRERDLEYNWDEHDYVVASTVVKRQSPSARRSSSSREAGRQEGRAPSRRRAEGTKVARRGSGEAERRGNGPSAPARRNRPAEGREDERAKGSPDSIFAVDLQKPDVSDFYEDEVFNVSNLPVFDEFGEDGDEDRRERKRRD